MGTLKYFVVLLWVLWLGGSAYAYDPATDVSSWARVDKTIKHPHYRESKWSYDLYISSGVYLRVLKSPLQPIRISTGATARSLQSKYGFDLTVNGGYFTYDSPTNTFIPAGRIVDGLRVIRSMVKEFWAKDLDKNLKVVLIYNKYNNILRVTSNDLIVPTTGTYARYTGPQIIQSGQTLTWINANLSHRQRRATRTFMIVDKDGYPHLWVAIQWYTLNSLATKIQEMKVFYWQYHVINMDGWSSTAFAAGTRYWSSRVRLPWFFGVK
jgi:hypothetical protein